MVVTQSADKVIATLRERAAKICQAEGVAGEHPRAVPSAVDPPALVGVAEDQVEDRVQVSLFPGDLDPGSSELDRGLEQLVPGKTTVNGMDRLQPGSRAGHRAGGLADAEDLSGLAVTAETDVDRVHLCVRRHRSAQARRRDEEISHARSAPIARQHERKASSTRACQRALGHPGGK